MLRPLDPAFPIERQLPIDASPVVLVNLFTLDKADEQTFLKVWADDAAFMKRQPGFTVGAHLPTLHYKRPEDVAHHRMSLLKAGLPA